MQETNSELVVSTSNQVETENQYNANLSERLKDQLQRYKRLTGDDKKTFLESQFSRRLNGELPYYLSNRFLILIQNSESGDFFGFNPEEGTLEDEAFARCIKETGVNTLVVAADAFQNVVSKYSILRSELSDLCKEIEDPRKGFPFRITKQRNFSVSSFGGGGELVGFGQDYLY